MQICYIMGSKASAPRGSNGEVQKDGKPPDEMSAAAQWWFRSESMDRHVNQNTSRHLGAPQKYHTEKCKDEFLESSLELLRRGRSSSSALRTRSAKLVEEEFLGSPSFRYYVEEDSESNLNKGSQLRREPLSMPIHEPTMGMLNRPHQLIDTSKPLHTNQEAQSASNEKKKGWKFKFQIRKNKNSRDTEPPQQEAPMPMPQFSPQTVAATLQKGTDSFLLHKVYQNINSTAILKESGVLVDSDELTAKNIKFSETQQNWVHEAGNSMKKASISDDTYVGTLRGNDKIMEIIDWDSDEEDMSDIVIELGESVARNTNLPKTKENKIAKAVNLIEEPVADNGLETEGAGEDTMEKTNLDLYEVHKSSDTMIMFDKLKNHNPNFGQKDGVSSTEETKIECTALAETLGMKELGKTSNADQELTEKDISSSNPALETIDEEYDPIEHPNLLEIAGKLTCCNEFGDQAPASSQVETYYNQNKEMDMRELKKVMEKIAAENKEMKSQVAGMHAQQSRIVNWLQGIGMAFSQMERCDEISMKSFERTSDSVRSLD